jgi:hypothetical protein
MVEIYMVDFREASILYVREEMERGSSVIPFYEVLSLCAFCVVIGVYIWFM